MYDGHIMVVCLPVCLQETECAEKMLKLPHTSFAFASGTAILLTLTSSNADRPIRQHAIWEVK